MPEIEHQNVKDLEKESNAIRSILHVAEQDISWYGGSAAAKIAIDTARKEICSINPEQLKDVAKFAKASIVENGNGEALAFYFSDRVMVPLDCKNQ